MKSLLKKINLLDLVFVPFWWYHSILIQLPNQLKYKPISKELARIHYSVQASVCCFDRSIIDEVLREIDLDELSEFNRVQADFDIGMALFDLGHREEGVKYLENAALKILGNHEIASKASYVPICLCNRLMCKQNWGKRLEYLHLIKQQFPEKENVDMALAKAYIDMRQFIEAKNVIKGLIDLDSTYKFLLADYYFTKGKYELAVKIFDAHSIYDSQNYWRPQFEYKSAVAYYKTNQKNKCHKVAKKIGRRIRWDRFYRLDTLEDEGVERIAEIDKMIEYYKKKYVFFDTEKINLMAQRIPRVFWAYCQIHSAELWFCLVGFFFFILFLLQKMSK